MKRRIMTSFQRKPIASAQFDWGASFEGDQPDENGFMLVGWGASKQEAIDDLIDKAAASEPFPVVPSGAYS